MKATPVWWPLLQNKVGKLVPEKQSIWILMKQETNCWVTVVSAGPIQIICTLLQIHRWNSTISFNFISWMLFLTPNQQCQRIRQVTCLILWHCWFVSLKSQIDYSEVDVDLTSVNSSLKLQKLKNCSTKLSIYPHSTAFDRESDRV